MDRGACRAAVHGVAELDTTEHVAMGKEGRIRREAEAFSLSESQSQS